MDIERLTKTQIILLTLLVSFVTSIATGIVTVTLLDQAPPAITQTISRVVERTIETVVPDKSQGASVITKEVTIVVKEDDLITDSIETNSGSLVRISREAFTENGDSFIKFVGLGIVVSGDGMVAMDGSSIREDSVYTITMADGNTFNTEIINNGIENSIVLLNIIIDEDEEVNFKPVIFADIGALKLGQSVIVLSGENRIDVAMGIISNMDEREVVNVIVDEENGEEITSTTTVLYSIGTNIDINTVLSGSPLINIFGEIIGMNIVSLESEKNTVFMPVTAIQSAIIASILSEEEEI